MRVRRALLFGLIFVTLYFERGQGTLQLSAFWENFIRGALPLIAVVFQSQLARRVTGRGQEYHRRAKSIVDMRDCWSG